MSSHHLLQRRQAGLAFGAVLREARLKRGLSQELLATLGGFDRTYTSLLERGLRTPTLAMIYRLADVLEVSAATLVADARGVMNRRWANYRGETQAPE